uniref:Metalloprotease TIKI homolog n=1 Tax=Acrobeloides nanus TaxID=290746 RepID=A0A914DQ93_9BILA
MFERLERQMDNMQPKDMDDEEWEKLWQSSKLHNIIFTLINAVTKDISARDMRKIKELEFEYFLGREAQKQNKTIAFVEPLEVFCDYKSDLTKEELHYDLDKQLKQLEEIQQVVQEMGSKEYSKMKIQGMEGFHEDYQNTTNKYLCGEWKEPKKIKPANKKPGSWSKNEKIEYEIHRKHEDFLLFTRTKKWIPKIESLLTENPKSQIFFALGTRHFLGQEGLERIFDNKPGYKVYSLDVVNIKPKLKDRKNSDEL